MIDNQVEVLRNYGLWQVREVLTTYANDGYKLVSAVMGKRDCSTVTELYLFFVKEEGKEE